MKILMVNAHTKTKNSSKKFSCFEKTIREAVESLIKIGYHAPYITVADLSNIDQFIYERGSRFCKEEARKVS